MTSQKSLARGAEAKIILDYQGKIIKHRIKKSYRIPELDQKIRTRRTKAEAKLLTKASKIINTPKILDVLPNEKVIEMKFIDGKKLSEQLDKFPLKEQKQILNQIGKDIAKLHAEDIIHGDLTTSNMIYIPVLKHKSTTQKSLSINNKNQGGSQLPTSGGRVGNPPTIFFIDFGLGFFNGKYEDKAVDIHLLKQALEAKHFKYWKILFTEFEKGYKSINKTEAEKVLNQLIKVERRGRYKNSH